MAGSFRKDKTTSANTAIMTAGGIVQGLIAAGKVTSLPKAVEAFDTLFDAALSKAGPVVDADNALFAEVEAAAPAPAAKSSGGGAKRGGSKGGQKPADAAGSLSLNSGPFKGQTIEDVYGLDAEAAKGEFGYTHGDGAAYITYLTTEDNPNSYTRDAAAAFLEQAA
jgi:hypothetical protein